MCLRPGRVAPLVLGAVDPTAVPMATRAGATATLSIRKPQSPSQLGELVRERRLDLADPALDRLLVDRRRRAHAGCRRRCLPAAGPPMPLRSSSAGDSIAPAATTTVGASTSSLVVDPSACVTVACDAGRAPVVGEDPLGAGGHDEAGAGVGGVLQEGLHRRLLAALLAARVAVAAHAAGRRTRGRRCA